MTTMGGEGERCRREPQSLTCFYVCLSGWRQSAIDSPPLDDTGSTQAADWSFHPTGAALFGDSKQLVLGADVCSCSFLRQWTPPKKKSDLIQKSVA